MHDDSRSCRPKPHHRILLISTEYVTLRHVDEFCRKQVPPSFIYSDPGASVGRLMCFGEAET